MLMSPVIQSMYLAVKISWNINVPLMIDFWRLKFDKLGRAVAHCLFSEITKAVDVFNSASVWYDTRLSMAFMQSRCLRFLSLPYHLNLSSDMDDLRWFQKSHSSGLSKPCWEIAIIPGFLNWFSFNIIPCSIRWKLQIGRFVCNNVYIQAVMMNEGCPSF